MSKVNKSLGWTETTKHHVIPLSRTKVNRNNRHRRGNGGRRRGSSRNRGPVVIIPKEDHELLHRLFGNLLPYEIIRCLVLEYWDGNWGHVYKALGKIP